jgi:chromate reductase
MRIMKPSYQLLAISGSLRAASSNTAVLQALAALAPTGTTITLYAQLADLPHFNPDWESDDAKLPAVVRTLRTQVGQVDGILISSPEYAHGVPGVLKNALDWLVGSVEFPYKPVALINISPRSIHAHTSLVEILTTMSAKLINEPALTIDLPRKGLDAAGMVGEPAIRAALEAALFTFIQAIQE